MTDDKKNIKISTRFSLFIGIFFLIACVILIAIVNFYMKRQALVEAESKALEILDNRLAIHTYFSHQLKPKMFQFTEHFRPKDYFEPTWMSSTYAVREMDKHTNQSKRKDFYYKECAINARSPENEADDYEREFLKKLAEKADLVSHSSIRYLAGRPYLAVLRRGETMEESCLRCHSDPQNAPKGLIDIYGSERSFHRKVGDVVQAISIRIPLSAAYASANRCSFELSGLLLVLFGLLFIAHYYGSRKWVFSPLDAIREKAILISTGSEHLGETIPLPAGRELYDLTTSFNRMLENLRLNTDLLEKRIKERTEELSQSNEHLREEIEQRIRTEESLRKSRNMLKTVLDSIPSAVFWKNRNLIYLGGNRTWLEVTGLKSSEEVIGKSDYDLTWGKEQSDAFREDDRRIIESGIPEYGIIESYLRADGIRAWARTNKVPVRDKDGNITGVLGTYEDITEQVRTEEERKKLQAQLSNAMEMAHLGHWEYDVAKDLFTFNDHFYKIFRTTAKQVGAYTMSSAEYARRFVHPDDMHVVEEENRKTIEATDPHFSRQLEHRMLLADGTIGHIAVRFFIVKDAQGKTVKTYGVNQDITERKKMEEELLRSQKLESVGILAGGIAHDFNNILTTILGNVSMARMQARPEDEMFDLLIEAEKASIRAQTLTKQLLTFAKGGAPLKEIASIKDILKESPFFVLRGSKSRCKLSMAEDLFPAEVDIGQISQVINNIVINANQAMPTGGIIQVTAENLIIDSGDGLPLKSGRYIRISIKDQGVGIAEKHLSKVFDPYFTTKQEGNGLGLATTYSIIKKHDGHITVESRPEIGTTFHIYLPASEKAVPENEVARIIKGRGRILVMDDEAPLRKIVGRMLEKLGYESEFAKDGTEAVRMVKEAKESETPYDAVILDLTVPGGMGGKEAIKKLVDIDLEVKAIVSSGYSDDPVLSNFQEYGFKGMMPKPFESRSLSKVLHEVLQGKGKEGALPVC